MLSILILNPLKQALVQYFHALGGIVPIFTYMNRQDFIFCLEVEGVGESKINQPFVNRFYIESKLHTDLRTELIKVFSRDVSDQHVTRFVFVCLFIILCIFVFIITCFGDLWTQHSHTDFSGWSPWWWRPKEPLLQFLPQPWLPCANTCIRWAWCCWCVRTPWQPCAFYLANNFLIPVEPRVHQRGAKTLL